jgi:hypothetical protein
VCGRSIGMTSLSIKHMSYMSLHCKTTTLVTKVVTTLSIVTKCEKTTTLVTRVVFSEPHLLAPRVSA